MNHKRVERIWSECGLKIPQKQPKARNVVAERRQLRAASAGEKGSCVSL